MKSKRSMFKKVMVKHIDDTKPIIILILRRPKKQSKIRRVMWFASAIKWDKSLN